MKKTWVEQQGGIMEGRIIGEGRFESEYALVDVVVEFILGYPIFEMASY
ncbi:hypothetical protein MQX03_14215 [Chryseobacterium aahli]|nr:hypothetical protein [Chryseobacterium aahli]MCI3938355.1 hypothetical protein [Chryseobacterium aahli]